MPLTENRQKSVRMALEYIACSPPQKDGGFHPTTVKIAKAALKELFRLRFALLLYHEAWNGCEGDWHSAMRKASKEADKALWKNRKPLRIK